LIIKQSIGKDDVIRYGTEALRDNFLIDDCFGDNECRLYYVHTDRVIVGGAMPTAAGCALTPGQELKCKYFLERREMGVINIGGEGEITLDGERYVLHKYDCLYIGRGTKDVRFFSRDDQNRAVFYINSCPAHRSFDSRLCTLDDAVRVNCGSGADCNERTINKYILPGNVESCQLVMGLTTLKAGSVWNTMPAHTHDRRMEVYLYFDIKPDNVVFHLMGEPHETRHIVVGNRQAVISPAYSIHSGVGTSSYSFIWGMCGENQDFDDMDAVKTVDLR
jgi:4-deoxy-L-threo-5-hexosulose-uronate ketol-isomerase